MSAAAKGHDDVWPAELYHLEDERRRRFGPFMDRTSSMQPWQQARRRGLGDFPWAVNNGSRSRWLGLRLTPPGQGQAHRLRPDRKNEGPM